MRKNETFAESDFEIEAVSENVLRLVRSGADKMFIILINLGHRAETVTFTGLTVKADDRAEVLLASPSSGHKVGWELFYWTSLNGLSNISTRFSDVLNADSVEIAAFEALVLVKSAAASATATLLLLAIVMLAIKLFLWIGEDSIKCYDCYPTVIVINFWDS